MDGIPIFCSACTELLPPGHALPCPKCGATTKTGDLVLPTLETAPHLDFEAIAYSTTPKKGFSRVWLRPDLWRKFGVWMHRHQLWDKKSDRYWERITHPDTGEVVHECDEPLSQHRGHGSAKPKT